MARKAFLYISPTLIKLKNLNQLLTASLKYGGTVLIPFVFTACAVLDTGYDADTLTPAWASHQRQMETVADWSLNGKLSLRYQDQRVHYKIDWRCRADDISFSLYLPTGQKTMEFSADSERAQVRDGRGDVRYADDGDALIKQALGIDVPLSSMCSWSKGIPDAGSRVATLNLNENSRLKNLRQASWQVAYSAYMPVGELFLPRKIDLHKGDLHIVLLVKDWQLNKL